MKYYFLINPNSGKNKKINIKEKIEAACKKRNISHEIIEIKDVHDVDDTVVNIPDEECVIFSVGGDGSVSKVIHGILQSKNKILGVIPAGSGNDFYKSLKKMSSGVHTIDVGKINERYFINIACIGLDADVANNIDIIKNKKFIPVKQRYNASLIYTFFKYKFKKLQIKMGDVQVEKDCTILAVCNGQYYGGGYRIAPHALLDDGMFDIYVVEKMPKPKMIPVLLKLIRGTHESSPKVEKYTDGIVTIDTPMLCSCNVDGDPISGTHFELKIQRNTLRVFHDKNLIEDIIR